MTNHEIANLLRNVAASYIIKNESKFRFHIIAYQKAADSIDGTPVPLKNYFKEGKLQNIPGIGVSIKGHLEELLGKGKVKHFEWAMEDIPKAVFALMKIPTFGPKKSYRLSLEFKLSEKDPMGDLEKIARKGLIAPLRGFGEKSEQDILRALEEYKEGKGKTTRMVLPIASKISDSIIEHLKENPEVKDARPLGSLRRRLPTVGDIDIAVASNNPRSVIDHFISHDFAERVIEKGKETASMLVSGGRQVDLMIQPPHAFGSLLQHFTGSKNHNIALREYALKKGLSLSEHGIKDMRKKDSRLINHSTEEEFYHAIGLEWIPPEIREGTIEIELAEKKKLPLLIKTSDVNGDFHLHSSFPLEPSHDLGKNTIKEMVDKARALNYSFVGFSEHNPSISKHSKSEIRDLVKKRNDEIEQVLSDNKSVRILKLLEVDILASGSLAVDEQTLDILDFALVSIHSNFQMDTKTITQRVISGLSHPKAKVLSHPTGRILNQRSGYDLDWDEIFDFCRKNNKALEINAWPTRLDLTDTMIDQARKNKVKMIINTDSHASYQMDNMEYGVAMARRGWAKKDDILNTLEYNRFVEWIKS
jgi:DNA polymerase (family 10)